MSLQSARKIVKRLRKAGILAMISYDSAACEKHNPNIHPMSGRYVVKECAVAVGQTEPRLFWE